MEACYETLLTVYGIVKDDPAPHTYLCTVHEIILHQPHDWGEVQKHLEQLQKDGFITVRQLDKLTVSITEQGLIKCRNLKNNFVVDHFSFTSQQPVTTPDKLPG